MTPPPVSRAGLARCPSCLTHVAVAADVSTTICAFCGGSFAAPSAVGTRAASSALVAALGLGLALSGCGPKNAPNPAPPPPEDPPAPVVPSDREIPPEAAYGGPPMDLGPGVAPPPEAAEAAPAPPPEPIQDVPVYGVAPMPVRPPVRDKPERER